MSLKGKHKKRCDPCGILCLLLTYVTIVYSNYAFIFHISWNPYLTVSQVLSGIIYQTLLILMLWAHYRASFTDPGVVNNPHHNLDLSNEALLPYDSDRLATKSPTDIDDDESDTDDKRWSICTKCQTYRPPKAHHCQICRRCIRKMDHHCPWINNCVGEMNQKYFLQFLFYVAIVSFYTITTILIELLHNQHPPPGKALHIFILLIMSLLFGVFVVAVLSDQATSIFSNKTRIDRLQKPSPCRVRPKKSALREVCGTDSIILWFFPCSSAVPKYDNQLVV